ncbi:Tafazzin family protein [Favolaschia claudopus]|uniref:Tafazzin family protein n=1 Tax=Favolaschia claudopus TaxID=2862362 RepID=A0AAW0EAF1_9AGAR
MTIPLLVHLTCKAALSTICSVSVHGLPHLETALSAARTNGLLTLANHISTLDDPVAWGALPTKYFLNARTIRWTLGASDIMFTNPVFSSFFRRGQVLETVRGIGKVNQPDAYPQNDGFGQLPRFKWGIGRVLMEVSSMPTIIPMWLTGFDSLMPEGRSFPYKYFPRPRKQLSITFGPPLDLEELDILRKNAVDKTDPSEIAQIRAEITKVLHDTVEKLGRSVSGNSLRWRAE